MSQTENSPSMFSDGKQPKNKRSLRCAVLGMRGVPPQRRAPAALPGAGASSSPTGCFPRQIRKPRYGATLSDRCRLLTRQSERGRAAFQDVPGGRSCGSATRLLRKKHNCFHTRPSQQRLKNSLTPFLFIPNPGRPRRLRSSAHLK